jgi:short subunit dehydrogenase-like uncharacterized protein
MRNKKWMIYGAYGYTGQLITKEAVSRGHKPVLAGRSADKLIPLAEKWNLEYRIFDLSDDDIIYKNVEDLDVVLHTAGPFIHTSAPMVRACLRGRINYLDITGEIPVFEQNFKYDEQARDNDIAIISGAGFDVVPTDCIAKYVSEKIPNPTSLELAIAGLGGISPGTLKTMLEHLSTGLLIRKNGQLTKLTIEKGARKIKFSDDVRTVVPAVWGDLATAFRSTGIPNIIVYMPLSKTLAELIKTTKLNKEKAQVWIEKNVLGPDEQTRKNSRSYIWTKVTNEKSNEAQAWLETMEGYRFTAIASVRCVEKVLEFRPKGALTPSLAFGPDFILEIPETERFDKLET